MSNTEVTKGLDLFKGGGLSPVTALNRLELEGFNEIADNRPKKLHFFIFNVLKEPMVYLLLGCGITYFFLGDREEALMLLGFLFFIIGITVFQEAKSERALEALKELSSPRAEVLRNGLKTRIAGRDVAREDIIFLKEGDRVPADAIMIAGEHLGVDEALLTGESLPVNKSIGDNLFSSTTVIHGEATAIITATGTHSQIGKIGKTIQHQKVIPTTLEIQTRQLVVRLSWIALAICILVVVVYAQTRNNLIGGILVGLSLGMAILPNELPAVLTIFFALGARRLSKKNVLTRKISAIENLGSITALCVDKTGTLTLNQMAIQKIYANGQTFDLNADTSILPESFHEMMEYGILASKRDPHDPMEVAFITSGMRFLKGTEHLHNDWKLEREYPISSNQLFVTYAWKQTGTDKIIVGAKGAPEAILKICPLDENQKKHLNEISENMATQGLRILGVAKATNGPALPDNQNDFTFTFLGFVGIADPIRNGVKEAVSECYTAGIRIIMMTGDHPITASSIAKKIGFQNSDKVITGSQLKQLSAEELKNVLKEVNIFSRVSPDQKLYLVESLKSYGEIIAMTGDGVNDAPALKSSHVGIAMGARGTDVARESADLVLLDDDFTSIVEAIRTGRRIYANLKNALVYLFAIHIPIAGMSVIPVISKLPLVLLPAHIAYLHLIIEPASSIAFEVEPAGKYLMMEKPRRPTDQLFNFKLWSSSLSRGLILLVSLVCIYLIALWRNQGEADARTLVITTLILSNTVLIYLSRPANISLIEKLKACPNQVVVIIIWTTFLMLGAALYIPDLRNILRFSFLHPIDLAICLSVTVLTAMISELVLKLFEKQIINKA